MKLGIHFGGIILRVAIYKCNNSLSFKSLPEFISCIILWIKTHLLQSPLYLKKQKQTKKTQPNPQTKKQCPHFLPPHCHCRYFFHLQVCIYLAGMFLGLLAGVGLFTFAFVFSCGQGRKGEGMLWEWKR